MAMLSGLLTPLLYLACGGLAIFLAHRWVRPVSLAAAGALIALPLVLTGPALLTAKIYGPVDLAYMGQPLYSARANQGVEELHSPIGGDVAFQMIPWRKAVRYEISHGRWPLWNRFMLSGDILAASAIPAPYHPVNLLSFLLPLGPSLVFVAAATLLSAALFAFLYLREIACREMAALVGAAAWMFSSFLVFWLQWPHALTVAALPAVFLAVRRVVRSPSKTSTMLLTASFVWVLLAGHPESAFHVVAVGAFYGIAELVGFRERRMVASIIHASAAAALALALSAVYLLPFLEAMPQSHEYGLRQKLYAGSDRSVAIPVALERLRVNVFPYVYGLPWEEEIEREDPTFLPLSSAYVGSCLFPFVLLALWCHPWRGRWLLLAMTLLGLSAGISAPGLSDVLAWLPLFDLSINKRLIFAAGFGLSSLAALGVEAWCGQRGERKAFLLSLAVLLVLASCTAGQWGNLEEAGLSQQFLVDQSLFSLLPLLLVAGLSAFRGLPKPSKVMLLFLLLAAQRGGEMAARHPVFSSHVFFPSMAVLEKLHKEEGIFRVVGAGTALLPNISALYELEDVRGYQGMYFARSVWTYPLWCESPPKHHYYQVDDLSRPFLSYLNVRFAIVSRGEPHPEGWLLWANGRGAKVYENPQVVERVFVPEKVWVDLPPAQMRRQMLRAQDFSETAWIELSENEGGTARPQTSQAQQSQPQTTQPQKPQANGPGQVRFERRPYGYVIDAEMEGAGWVVVSETAWRGWRVFEGEKELPLAFANRAFLGLYLSEGRHRVDLVYRPRSFLLGRAITLVTVLILFAWWGGRKMVRSREAAERFRTSEPR